MKQVPASPSVLTKPSVAGVPAANAASTLASVVNPYSLSPQISSQFTAAVPSSTCPRPPSPGDNHQQISSPSTAAVPSSTCPWPPSPGDNHQQISSPSTAAVPSSTCPPPPSPGENHCSFCSVVMYHQHVGVIDVEFKIAYISHAPSSAD